MRRNEVYTVKDQIIACVLAKDDIQLLAVLQKIWSAGYNTGIDYADSNPRKPESMGR